MLRDPPSGRQDDNVICFVILNPVRDEESRPEFSLFSAKIHNNKNIASDHWVHTYTVNNPLGPGFLEKIYENALVLELSKAGLNFKQKAPLSVHYENLIIGDFRADLLIEDAILVELKAVKSLEKIHHAQCLNYLKATDLKLCLLIIFGTQKVQIKRIVN